MRRNHVMVASFAMILSAVPAALRAQTSASVAATDSVAIPLAVDTARVDVERNVTPATVDRGTTLAGLRAGVRAPVTAPVAGPSIARNTAGLGQAKAMMIVGGAAVVLGAIIGDTPGTLFMVGGAIVGLYGLYQYLQ